MATPKTVDIRIAESVNMHKQLARLGVLQDDLNRHTFATVSNAFVREGRDLTCSLRLRDDAGTHVRVYFRCDQQSGLELVT